MGKCNSTAMMWMVMIRGGESVWARINYGRSNQVIMQSRQQPSGKKLITAPDRSRSRRRGRRRRSRRRGRGRRRRRGDWWGRRRNKGLVVKYFLTSCAMCMFIHPKSEKVCRVQNIVRKKCVNFNDKISRQKCVNHEIVFNLLTK